VGKCMERGNFILIKLAINMLDNIKMGSKMGMENIIFHKLNIKKEFGLEVNYRKRSSD